MPEQRPIKIPTAADLYNMELFSTIIIHNGRRDHHGNPFNSGIIMRIPGGWVYRNTDYGDDDAQNPSITSCFVPYSDEFKPCK